MKHVESSWILISSCWHCLILELSVMGPIININEPSVYAQNSERARDLYLDRYGHDKNHSWLYLDLSVSRHDGRYLSNRMVRLAFSDWTSLPSIQLDTGGFQPKSAGLMYKIPVWRHISKILRLKVLGLIQGVVYWTRTCCERCLYT